MKQSVFFKTMLSVMAALPLLTACDSENAVTTNNQANNELKINVGIATPQRPSDVPAESRVINPTGATIYTWGSQSPEKDNPANFGANESIGIFLREKGTQNPYGFVTWDGNTPPNPQITGPYDNLEYKSVGNYRTGLQTWNYVPSVGKPAVPLPAGGLTGIESKLCAYYPYDPNVTYDGNEYNFTSSSFGAGSPYTLVPIGITGSPGKEVSSLGNPTGGWLIDSSTGIDYMYCPETGPVGAGSPTSGICAGLPMVNITFHHAQTCLRFKVSVPATFSGSAKITRFKVYGGFTMKSRVDIWTGDVTERVMPPTVPGGSIPATMDTIEVKASASSVLKTINTTTSYTPSYFCVPLNESVATNLNIEIDIDGHTYRATISSLVLKREWMYEIPLMLTDGHLVVHKVDIIPWTIDSSIPVTPLL